MQPLVHPNEVVDLLIFLIAIPVFARITKITPRRSNFDYGIAYMAMLVALTATILEGLFWPDLLNGLEHVSYAVAGIGFAIGTFRLPKPDRTQRAPR